MSAHRSANPNAAARTAWFLLDRLHPSLARVFLTIVLPLSLLPPLMLYYAGTYHGDDFMAGFAQRNWAAIGALFFAAEMLTVAAMGPVIQGIARLNDVAADRNHAYLLAFAAPVPMWLSSLGLFVPNFFFAAAVGVAGAILSCYVIYHGVAVLLHVAEDIVAGAIAYGIMAGGLMAWALLLILVIPLG